MTFTSRGVALAAAACLAAGCTAGGPAGREAATGPPPRHLRVLHLNDAADLGGGPAGGGLARAATVVRNARGDLPRVLVTGGGDLLAPSRESLLLDGAPAAAAWRALGLAAAVPGDRDLALGPDILARRAGETGARWTAANLSRAGRPCCGAEESLLLDLDGLRVGVAGVVGADAARAAGAFRLGLDVGDPVAAARRTVAALRRAGADVVLLLAHGDVALLEVLARGARPDVVLGGHQGTPVLARPAGVPVVRAARGALDVAQVDLWVRPAGGVAGLDLRFLPVDADLAPDPALGRVAADAEAAFVEAAARGLGSTAVVLDSRLETAGAREAPLGNLLADLAREATGADAALVDAGSLGAVLLEAGPLPADLGLRLFPDLGPLAVLEASGADLLGALEHALTRLPAPSTRFVQVSGIRATFDPGAEPGARLREAHVGGAPLDAARPYRLAVTARLAAGGDGHARLRAARRLVPEDAAPFMAGLVLARQRAGAPLAPEVEGRLRAIGSQPE